MHALLCLCTLFTGTHSESCHLCILAPFRPFWHRFGHIFPLRQQLSLRKMFHRHWRLKIAPCKCGSQTKTVCTITALLQEKLPFFGFFCSNVVSSRLQKTVIVSVWSDCLIWIIKTAVVHLRAFSNGRCLIEILRLKIWVHLLTLLTLLRTWRKSG